MLAFYAGTPAPSVRLMPRAAMRAANMQCSADLLVDVRFDWERRVIGPG
jgi:hypothetical protein